MSTYSRSSDVCGLKDEAPATRDKRVGCVAEFQNLIELRHT